MTRFLATALLFLSLCSPSSALENPVLDELKQLRTAQEEEMNRLNKMRDALPVLTQEQSKKFAEKLAKNLESTLDQYAKTSDEATRAQLFEQARRLLETVCLLAKKLDLEDTKKERVREYELKVERRRWPLKIIMAVSGTIETIHDLIKERPPDVLGIIENHSLESYKISDEEWSRIQAEEFIETFKKNLTMLDEGLSIAPGLDGALKSRDHVLTLLQQRKCNLILLGGR